MDYILWGLAVLIAAILLFALLNDLLKRYKKPGSAHQGIWNAIYFMQLKQYDKALAILDATEKEYAMDPEVMCDLCVQRADAHRHLGQHDQAAAAYDILFDALQECEGKLKRNDALLAELQDSYTQCGRATDFKKWEQLFAALPEAEI